ncbi:hypothetical protein K1T71_008188 [Dendrolimus kikuchii]|uniref:Uncharacterized protein n=1 Tax=Dendrolimus kikuchii TaxID=765133 RepID=A0ACC1CWD2_9NEOP|nr:hypothetical protein K1T71_008188 [Dendrolimus kikuchii]
MHIFIQTCLDGKYTERMSMEPYFIKPVEKDDVDAVMKLLKKTFFIDEPMNQAVALCVETGTCPELEEYCFHSLLEGLSYKALDSDGNIVGVIINGVCPLKEDQNDNVFLSQAQRCTNPKFQKILYILAKREDGSRLWEKFPDETVLVEVKVAATDPKWRRRGIMNELVKVTEKATIDRNIRLLRMDTSSAYSAMSAQRLGFTCMYSAPYTEIKMDGKPLIVPEPPHVDDRVYVKTLFERL